MTSLAPSAGLIPTDGPFDLIAGIPVHPLVVHAAVVLLPLSALALIAIIIVPRLRRPLGWLTMAGLAVGAGAAIVARLSGEQLAARVGEPQQHLELGEKLPFAAVLLFVVGAVWFWLQRRAAAAEPAQRSVAQTIVGIVAILVALATIALTVAVGHTGATAVWEGRILPATPASTPAATPDASASPSVTADAGAVAGLTMADVQAHATPADCWAVVSGTVYDLTSWIAQHPGGEAVIEALCGTDATAAFTAQHQGQGKPTDTLAGFEIDVLVTPSAAGADAAITPASVVVAGPRADRRYTLKQVRKHRVATDCWAAVNGSVYNLTRWVNQHPGGASRIIALCGTNASAAFNAQHGSAANVATILAGYRIGVLA